MVQPKKIGDSTIRVVFKLTHDLDDSGVFIRIPEKPTEPWMPVNRGYEIEIGNWPDDYSCTGVVYTFTKALARPLKPIGQWNTMDITAKGSQLTVVFNGVQTVNVQDSKFSSGPIALQYGSGVVKFRKVEIKPL